MAGDYSGIISNILSFDQMKNIKMLFSLVLIILCFTLSGQNAKNSGKKSENGKETGNQSGTNRIAGSTFLMSAETSDMLDLNETLTSLYLMEKSPLKVFQNYRDIYDSYYKFSIVELDVDVTSFIPPSSSRQGLNTPYYVSWFLIDSTLYLGNITFFDKGAIESAFPDNKQYRIMEELTQVKFDKKLGQKYALQNSKEIEYGLMPAIWVNDTLLVKRGRGPYFNSRQEHIDYYRKAGVPKPKFYPVTSIEEWHKTPCIELVFRKGKLVSMKEREGMH